MNPPAAPDYFELSDYTTVLRRRWRRIAGVTLAGVVLAAAYVFLALRRIRPRFWFRSTRCRTPMPSAAGPAARSTWTTKPSPCARSRSPIW